MRAGQGLVSLGTSGVVLSHDSAVRVDPTGAIHAFCAAVPGGYHLMSVMLSAGGSLRWFRDLFGRGGETYDDLAREAGTVAAGSEGVTFLPYLAGERTPHMNPDARAAWTGLALSHTRAHAIRAVLEGVAFGLDDGLVRMRALGVDPELFVGTGNGMANEIWRGAIASIFERPISRLLVDEGPAFGAALLAAVGIGTYGSVEDAARRAVPPSAEPTLPDPATYGAYRAAYRRFTSLYPALHPAPSPSTS